MGLKNILSSIFSTPSIDQAVPRWRQC
jgi:hypothetical protein